METIWQYKSEAKWNLNPLYAATVHAASTSTLLFYFITSSLDYILIRIFLFLFFLLFFSASTFECASQCVSAAQWCAEDTSTTSLNGNKFAEWMCRWERVWAGQPTTRTRSCAASGYIEQSTKHNNEWALKRLRKVERCSTYFRAANTHTRVSSCSPSTKR